MKFDKSKIEKIVLLGTQGMTFSEISRELGLLPIQLEKLRKENKELNEALNDWRFHYELYLQEEMEKRSAELKSPIAKELYKMLIDKQNKNDNEIIIHEV